MEQDEAPAALARRARLDAWFAEHHGVVSLAELRRFGYSKSAVYRMVARGELVTLLPGVLKGSQWPSGREQLMVAVCLRCPAAVIALLTAAEIWTFRKVPKDSLIHVMIPHGTTIDIGPLGGRFVVHRCRRVDPVDIVQRADGIRVMSPTRALLDIADIVREAAAGSILEQLINDGKGNMATHITTLARLGHSRRPGTHTMARVIAARPKWRAAMQSDLEVRVLAEIRRQGLPIPELQYVVTLPNGEHVRLDFAWPLFRELLEVDHPFWHAGNEESHKDKRRDRKMATIGWHTTRVTDFDVDDDGGLRESIADLAVILRLATHRA